MTVAPPILSPKMRGRILILIGALSAACEAPVAGTSGFYLQPQRVGAETDQLPLFDLINRDKKTIARNIRAAAMDQSRTAIVDADGVLHRLEGDRRVRLFDRASGTPAILADGSIVCSRYGDEPGETDLWIAPKNAPPRAIDPQRGPDDLPVALPDGSVLFVSGRSSVASWWRVDPREGEAVQLTNHGLIAGKPLTNFVPVAAERAEVIEGRVRYDAGGDRWFELDLADFSVRGVKR